MDETQLDLAIISNQNSVYYYTGFQTNRPILSEVLSWTLPAYLIATKDEDPILLVGEKERDVAAKTFGGQIITYVNYDLSKRMIAYPDFIAEEMKRIITKFAHLRRIGVEAWNIPKILISVLPQDAGTHLVDLSSDILSMRAVKDSDEIEALRTSCQLNDFAYSVARKKSTAGNSELDVYASVQYELTRKVGSYQLFAGDFVSGERSLEIGGYPTARVLKNGETFILDLWLTTKGYWSDMCRTFVIGTRASAEQKRILEILKQAMTAGEEKLRPRSKGWEVHKAVFDVIAKAGYAKNFPHHAGHALGLDDQEPPFFIPGDNVELRENNVCTLEPGVYIPGVGGFRIENNYLVKSDHIEHLTQYSLEL
jgi:Xaa-Pro aminopeptidase